MSDHLDSRDIVNPETRHEQSDVNVRALFWAMVVFVVFAAGTHFMILLMFRFYARHFRAQNSEPMTSVAMPADANLPPLPRLQPFPNRDANRIVAPPNRTTPVTDMEEMRASEDHALQNAGWVDRQKGVVRLPIEVAKQLVLQRGFAVTVDAGAPASTTLPPAEANAAPAPGPADATQAPSVPPPATRAPTSTSSSAAAPASNAAAGGGKRP